MIRYPIYNLVYKHTTIIEDAKSKDRFITCTLFPEDKVKQLFYAAATVEKLLSNMMRTTAVVEANDELRAELHKINSDDRLTIARIDRRFRAYVMEFKLFSYHWEKYISDLKKINEQYGGFYDNLYRTVTKAAYDTCEEYVLATVLRNYVVHAYDSISHLHIDGGNSKAYVLKDDLLQFKMSASAKKVVLKQPELINLAIVAQKSLEALHKIQEILIEFQLKEDVVEAVHKLLNAKKIVDESGIKADLWYILKEQKPKHAINYNDGMVFQRINRTIDDSFQEESIILPLSRHGIDINCKPLHWDGYVGMASFINEVREEGFWQKLEKKYGDFAGKSFYKK
ncbi:hypothetical protein SAMN04487864_101216 [Succiniclasticum ruminis]|uniref:Uncharacterized protein n=2 Tax=Succiniclasticum ruminis TaxID=40841 RepID=A0A1G6HUN0_9FIRM|nr:hypothetical protein SAMN04487864_101216 [Succiniclasticum ruminis]